MAKTKFAPGPAATTAIRCHTLFAGKLSGSFAVPGSTVVPVGSASPSIFTKPPSGMALTFQRVPWRSLRPKSSGPKPIEKVSTRTPLCRASR